jgi:hypothetical protein
MMNEHDRSNLEFLLNADEQTIQDWHSKVSADDHAYAHELLDLYSKELKERALALKVEAELAMMSEYPDAKRVIDKVRV